MTKLDSITPKQLVEAAKAKGKTITIEEAEKRLAQAKAHFGAEAALQKKYGIGSGYVNKQGQKAEVDIIPGSLTPGNTVPVKNDAGKPKWAGKMCVKIRCAHPGCKEERWLATSDLHNVARCEEHQKEFKAKTRKKSGKTATASDNLKAAEFLADLLS